MLPHGNLVELRDIPFNEFFGNEIRAATYSTLWAMSSFDSICDRSNSYLMEC